MYPLEGKQLAREEIRVIVAEAHVWQKRADLRRLDLRNANLIGADLREADLEGANLSGARLENAILLRAVLGGANLQDAQLRGALLRESHPALAICQRCGAGICGAHLVELAVTPVVGLAGDSRSILVCCRCSPSLSIERKELSRAKRLDGSGGTSYGGVAHQPCRLQKKLLRQSNAFSAESPASRHS